MHQATTYTQLDFLRHGEPLGGRKYRGQTDDPLSEKGWAQMYAAVGRDRPWQAIVSSPLSRCQAFAQVLAGEMNLALRLDDRFQEVVFGEWEGKTPQEVMASDPDRLFNFRRDPLGARPVGAEDLALFQQRVARGFDDLVAAHSGRHVLVVAHAGVIRMAICHVLGMPLSHAYRIQVGSAAMARFRVEARAGRQLAQLLWLTPGPG
jgi:alpha-ribazole phosphatase